MKDEEFSRRYREAIAETLQDATRKSQQLLNPSLSALEQVMGNADAPAAARVSAARVALDFAAKLTETMDVLSRLGELERQLGGDKIE